MDLLILSVLLLFIYIFLLGYSLYSSPLHVLFSKVGTLPIIHETTLSAPTRLPTFTHGCHYLPSLRIYASVDL